MDIEYISKLVGDRVRDAILYDKDGNFNDAAAAGVKYAQIRRALKGLVPLDELEVARG